MAKLDGLARRIETLEARQPPIKSDMQKFLEKCAEEELRRLGEIIEMGYDDLDKLPPDDRLLLKIWRSDMGIAERLRGLEDRAKCRVPSYDLFADMKRYEAIFEEIEAGSSLDLEDPDVQTCLEYEGYFAELERTSDEAGS